MKLKTVYTCEKCAYQSPKWIGRCPECESWNSFSEDVINVGKLEKTLSRGLSSTPTRLLSAEAHEKRIKTNINEFDQVLGGGLVKGSLVLISGEPGIGKSTITMHIADNLGSSSILYVSGEESASQISMRAKRMEVKNEKIEVVSENNLENIIELLHSRKPEIVIVDSIQVISSTEIPSISGSIAQVRFCTENLMNMAKTEGITIIIIGHVNKDGNLAGPKILEHLVDTVLIIEGERFQNLRILRSLKNRFGSTNEVGIFEMTETGLLEVANASKLFLEGRKENAFGSAITATIEGTRPILLEVQALTNISTFGYPKRAASGFDLNRLQLLIAVIQKHLGLNMANQDVFINVVGGYRLDDPAADLAVIMAIISSYQKYPLPESTVYLGEVGLSGEIRAISHLSKRIAETEKIGFQQIIIPSTGTHPESTRIKSIKVKDLGQLANLGR